MSREFPESDWKKFRVLKALALERFSEETLRQVAAISNDSSRKKPTSGIWPFTSSSTSGTKI